jgi:hypothetical protein
MVLVARFLLARGLEVNPWRPDRPMILKYVLDYFGVAVRK